jgi:branched-chain amino acid transport system ATP-binding protein
VKVLLSVNKIKVHYGMAEALRGVSLQIPQGSVISVIGANGAGKSTLLRTIVGLIAPTAGEIWLLDKRIDGIPAHRIVSLGLALAPEGRRLFPYMTVSENLNLGAYSRNDRRGKIRKQLEDVFGYFPILEKRSRQKAGTLSGGEQQMLTIGRALMGKPELLLMDEPSVGLAPMLVKETAKVTRDIKRQGITILLAEQNSSLVFEVADRVHVLENGLTILEGSSKELGNNEHVKRAYLGR